MAKYIAIILIFPALLFGQTEWTVELTVETVDTSLFLRGFGIADGATDGYDVLFDMPLFMAPEDTTVFFPVDGGWVDALSYDIRSNRVSNHTWNLVFQNMLFGTANWFSDSLPPDGDFRASVYHPDSTPDIWYDMRIVPALPVPAGRCLAFHWEISPGGDTIPPFVTAWNPTDGATDVPRETDIYCEVYDDSTGVDESSISLEVNGIDVTLLADIAPITDGFSVTYDPLLDFGWETEVTVVLSALDLETPSNFGSDTVVWTTIEDSLGYTVAGTVGTGDPWVPVAGAIVNLAGKVDTTGISGYFWFDSISESSYTIAASATGYETAYRWVWVHSDTNINITLNISAPPEVLIIDYDSGWDYEDDTDTDGEETRIANLLEYLGYSVEVTGENPDIDSIDLDAYEFVVLLTPARDSVWHAVIPDIDLNALASWLAADGRILWLAPDAGPDYALGSAAASNFFDMFGAVYESDGRAAIPYGNVAWLYGDGRDFLMDVYVPYLLLSPADNFIDEFSAAESTAYVAMWSQDSLPSPIAATGRMIFYDSMTYRTVLTSVFFGAIEGSVFPNTSSNILRACMDYLEIPAGVREKTQKPEFVRLKAYPNPFNSTVNIRVSGLGFRVSGIEIFDIGGRKVWRSKAPAVEFIWQPENSLSTGVYLIRETSSGATAKLLYLK
ncbi:hypothetical protein DRQ36_09120 [bacterium]|nr:MAG: hypothetical protein DRQ36_09120 [bacterium]